MILGFKFRLSSVDSLSKDIENSAGRLKTSMNKIHLLMPKILELFEEVKQIKPEFDKLHGKVSELEEYNPHLQNTFHSKAEKMSEKTSAIFLDLGRVFEEIENSANSLKHIILDADSIIYKENKLLDKYIQKIDQMPKSELQQKILGLINQTKQDFMSVSRRLYEAAKAEQSDIIEAPKKSRKMISDELRTLGSKIDEVGRILEHLDIDDIDEIVKNSHKQLDNLETIELEAIVVMRKLEDHILKIKNRLYLLSQDVADKVRQKTINTERKFDKIKDTITESAEKLLKGININQEIE